jgi:HEAT repeat protein
MRCRHLVAVVAFLLPFTGATHSQALETQGRLPTFAESLQRHGIGLTKAALVDALRNVKPEVRSLASQKLAEDKVRDAVPAIVQALDLEKVGATRVNIAFALAQLGETRGVSALHGVCGDSKSQTGLRLRAASYLLNFLRHDDQPCRRSLIEILQNQPDGHSFGAATSVLRQSAGLSPEESREIVQAALKALSASEPILRLAASQLLGEIGNGSSLRYLQSALEKEKDATIRSQMQADLNKIHQRQKQ